MVGVVVGVECVSIPNASFICGTDSPVRLASLTTAAPRSIRQSQGIVSLRVVPLEPPPPEKKTRKMEQEEEKKRRRRRKQWRRKRAGREEEQEKRKNKVMKGE